MNGLLSDRSPGPAGSADRHADLTPAAGRVVTTDARRLLLLERYEYLVDQRA